MASKEWTLDEMIDALQKFKEENPDCANLKVMDYMYDGFGIIRKTIRYHDVGPDEDIVMIE